MRTRGLFDDAGADLEQAQPEVGALCMGEERAAGNGVAQGEHQPIVCGVQDAIGVKGVGL